MKKFEPQLHILMRKDMKSMTGGKAAAQAAHASTYFTFLAEHAIAKGEPFPAEYVDWMGSTKQAFGVTYVREVNAKTLEIMIQEAQNFGYVASTILDPTYPVTDGDTVHLISLNTCGFVFTHTNDNPFYDKLKALNLW